MSKERGEVPTSRHPAGIEDANVAFNTRSMDANVMYHLLATGQFLGFSISPSAKSTCPSALRYGIAFGLIFPLLYGLASGLERTLSMASITAIEDCEAWWCGGKRTVEPRQRQILLRRTWRFAEPSVLLDLFFELEQ